MLEIKFYALASEGLTMDIKNFLLEYVNEDSVGYTMNLNKDKAYKYKNIPEEIKGDVIQYGDSRFYIETCAITPALLDAITKHNSHHADNLLTRYMVRSARPTIIHKWEVPESIKDQMRKDNES